MKAAGQGVEIINKNDKNNFEECPPRADALIHSIRAFGYDLRMAIADLIDNSIYASASKISIEYSWNNGNPWIRILDDGSGMTEERLYEAMRLGSQSPVEQRDPDDLGRFGLGLKTASFSQCRFLSVFTKTDDGKTASRFWDLDHVQETRRWELGRTPPEDVCMLSRPLQDIDSGTVIIWKNLDQVIDHTITETHDPESSFVEKFLSVKEYLETVFHNYLQGKRRKITIRVGVAECNPWDPFLSSNAFTQELSFEKYEDSRVSIVPYVLPHVSNRTSEETMNGAGIKGWNAQQGFYVYRNGRMIVSGGYLDLDLQPEEHYKLARIRVEITNDMDKEWSIDVRKAVASPPDRLRGELLRIARHTRQKASEVYRARAGRIRTHSGKRSNLEDVWLKIVQREKITYKINKKNSAIEHILAEMNPSRSWVNKLFHIIETTVPHRLIIMDGLEHEDCHVDLPDDLDPPPAQLLELCEVVYRELRDGGRKHEEAADIVCSMEPFNSHPGYRAVIDGLVEENDV
ncbi:MAG: ATP-binding protein [Thermoleophilia bacterium]